MTETHGFGGNWTEEKLKLKKKGLMQKLLTWEVRMKM
jgi:hypothetical protein